MVNKFESSGIILTRHASSRIGKAQGVICDISSRYKVNISSAELWAIGSVRQQFLISLQMLLHPLVDDLQ